MHLFPNLNTHSLSNDAATLGGYDSFFITPARPMANCGRFWTTGVDLGKTHVACCIWWSGVPVPAEATPAKHSGFLLGSEQQVPSRWMDWPNLSLLFSLHVFLVGHEGKHSKSI